VLGKGKIFLNRVKAKGGQARRELEGEVVRGNPREASHQAKEMKAEKRQKKKKR